MNKSHPLPRSIRAGSRAMMFIDGENLAIRYKAQLAASAAMDHVLHIPNVAVWSPHANLDNNSVCEIVRRHYYTSCTGDTEAASNVCDELKKVGIQQPHVFHKRKNGRSKRVDISLTTDMMAHAHRRNYDIAILVTGDEDYVPLVEAVKSEGRRVVLWALENGLNPKLERAADYAFDIGYIFFSTRDGLNARTLFDS